MSICDAATLHTAVLAALKDADIPAGHRHAFSLVATVGGGVKGVLTTKLNEVWVLDAVFAVESHQPIDAGVQLKATWD